MFLLDISMKAHRKTAVIPLKSNYPVCILKKEKKKRIVLIVHIVL